MLNRNPPRNNARRGKRVVVEIEFRFDSTDDVRSNLYANYHHSALTGMDACGRGVFSAVAKATAVGQDQLRQKEMCPDVCVSDFLSP